MHALNALEQNYSKKNSFFKAKDMANQAEMISDFRNSTLRFVRSNYYLYIDNFKHEVVVSNAQDRKYFSK